MNEQVLYDVDDEELLCELTSRLDNMPEEERISSAANICHEVASCCGIYFGVSMEQGGTRERQG